MTAEFPVAVHALVYLLHKNVMLSSGELAENICTNPARVRKIMAKLHRAGLVQAQKGQGSGYLTLPDGGDIPLSAVLRALEEEPVSVSWRSGDVDKDCLVSSGMAAVMDGVYARMNAAGMRELESITIGSINDTIFNKKGK